MFVFFSDSMCCSFAVDQVFFLQRLFWSFTKNTSKHRYNTQIKCDHCCWYHWYQSVTPPFSRCVLLAATRWVMASSRLTGDFTTWGQPSVACWSSTSAPIFGSKKPELTFLMGFILLLGCLFLRFEQRHFDYYFSFHWSLPVAIWIEFSKLGKAYNCLCMTIT